jgi:serine/threonine protein kinase
MSKKVDVATLPKEAKKALETFTEFDIASFNDSGANGYVMIGHHNVLQREVAIKIYFHEQHERHQEPALLASISHSNILKVYDARNLSSTCSFFLMQSASDGDFYTYLQKYNIPNLYAHKLLCELLAGVAALHSSPNFLVHRDIKPENLLINNETTIIADFGSVRKVDEETGKTPSSKHSILYRPPEAFGSEAYFDFSSDVYQAGLIGYLLFGGSISNDLLDHLTTKEKVKLGQIKKEYGVGYETSIFVDSCIEKRIKTTKISDFSSLPFFVPESVKRALRKAICERSKRYNSPSEFLAALVALRPTLPNWVFDGGSNTYILDKWKGNDYVLFEEGGRWHVKRKKSTGTDFRKDSSLSGATVEEAYIKLKGKILLP